MRIVSSKYYIRGFWLSAGLLSALSSNGIILLSGTARPNAFTMWLSHQSICSFYMETALLLHDYEIPLVLLGLSTNNGLLQLYLDLGTFCLGKRYSQRWCVCLSLSLLLCYWIFTLVSYLLCVYIFQTFLWIKSFMWSKKEGFVLFYFYDIEKQGFLVDGTVICIGSPGSN